MPHVHLGCWDSVSYCFHLGLQVDRVSTSWALLICIGRQWWSICVFTGFNKTKYITPAYILLVKANLMAKPGTWDGEINSTSWWEDLTMLTIFQSATFFLVTTVKNHVFYLRNSLLLDMNVVFYFLSVYKQNC